MQVFGPPWNDGDEPTPTLSKSRNSVSETPTGSISEIHLGPGDRVGRYVVLSLLGSGGMGVVYAAYDPRLDRKVALKLLRRSAGSEESSRQARLLREAQALAKLNDPHVLTIYDVGTFEGQIFLAIEHVAGEDLSLWLRAEKRSLTDILRVFGEAGRGLASAHRRGLVHRDFKPSNVMVRSSDGRASVLDFGLARSGAGEPPGEAVWEEEASGEVTGSALVDKTLTRAGSWLGTPLFMAPEQWAGEPGAAADQFSFCASLYLALYGEPPFDRGDRGVQKGLPSHWRVRSAPEENEVPAYIRRLLVRGLSERPEDRFPNMEALLRALDADPRRRRLRLGALSVALFLAAAAGFFSSQGPKPCIAAGERIEPVWSLAKKNELGRAFGQTGRIYAQDISRTVGEMLDGYSSSWRETYQDACEATRVRGDQSPQLMDRRIACLEERRRELSSLITLFLDDPEGTVDIAMRAVGDLSPLEPCSDTAALMAPVALPADAETRQDIAALREKLAKNNALRMAGRYQVAAQEAETLLHEAEELAYQPVIAEALLRRGMAEEGQSQVEEALASYERAVWIAQASQHDRVAATALTQLVRVAGYFLSDYERGSFFADLAESTFGRLDRAEDLEARLRDHRGVMELTQGRLEEAADLHLEALRLHEKRLGSEHPDVALSLIRLGTAYHDLGRFDEAREFLGRAVAMQRRSLGPRHTALAVGLDRLGNIEYQLGNLEAAEAHYGEALEIQIAAFGPDHVRVATTLLHQATVFSAVGRHGEALDFYARAQEIYEASYGHEHPNVAAVLSNIGTSRMGMGQFERAIEVYDRALEIQVATLREGHPALATTYFNLGEARNKLGEFERAAALNRQAMELWRQTYGEGHFLLGYGLTGLGHSLLGLGQEEQAIETLGRALELWRTYEQDPVNQAWARWLLAQALAEREPERAESIARQALEGYQKTESDDQRVMGEIEAWLAGRSGAVSPPPSQALGGDRRP